jgi:hypothetical protein
MNGVGPDRVLSGIVEYDPTNGTVSFGDIIRSKKRAEHQEMLPE